MFNALTALGYGVIAFAIVVGIGTIVLQNLNTAVGCSASYPYYNTTTNICMNGTADPTTNTSALNDAGTSMNYLQGKLGEGSGGLASWTPAVIALAIGMLFLGAFLTKKGKSY